MRNCYGLRDLYNFFDIPYINSQRAIIQQKLNEVDFVLAEKKKLLGLGESITYFKFVNKLNARKPSTSTGIGAGRQRKRSDKSHTVESSATSSEVKEDLARDDEKADFTTCSADNGMSNKHEPTKKMETTKATKGDSKFIPRRIMRVRPEAKRVQRKVLTEEEQLDAFLASSDEEDDVCGPSEPLDPDECEDYIESEDDAKSYKLENVQMTIEMKKHESDHTESYDKMTTTRISLDGDSVEAENVPLAEVGDDDSSCGTEKSLQVTIETKKQETNHPASNDKMTNRISSDGESVEAENASLAEVDDGSSRAMERRFCTAGSEAALCNRESLRICGDSKIQCIQNTERKESGKAEVDYIPSEEKVKDDMQISIVSDGKCSNLEEPDANCTSMKEGENLHRSDNARDIDQNGGYNTEKCCTSQTKESVSVHCSVGGSSNLQICDHESNESEPLCARDDSGGGRYQQNIGTVEDEGTVSRCTSKKPNDDNGEDIIESTDVDDDRKSASISQMEQGRENQNSPEKQAKMPKNGDLISQSRHHSGNDISVPGSAIVANDGVLPPKTSVLTDSSSKERATLKQPPLMIPRGCGKDDDSDEDFTMYRSRVQIVNESDEKTSHLTDSYIMKAALPPSPGVSTEALRAIKMAQEALQNEARSEKKKKKKKDKHERKRKDKKKEKKGKKRSGDASLNGAT